MFEAQADQSPQKIAFLLLPQFSMMAFTASVEPLRAANRLSGKPLYSWRTLSIDGDNVEASNKVMIVPDGSLHDDLDLKTLFVCAGINAERFQDKNVFGRLRDLSRHGVALGGVCTGSLMLARAGLLDG